MTAGSGCWASNDEPDRQSPLEHLAHRAGLELRIAVPPRPENASRTSRSEVDPQKRKAFDDVLAQDYALSLAS